MMEIDIAKLNSEHNNLLHIERKIGREIENCENVHRRMKLLEASESFEKDIESLKKVLYELKEKKQYIRKMADALEEILSIYEEAEQEIVIFEDGTSNNHFMFGNVNLNDTKKKLRQYNIVFK